MCLWECFQARLTSAGWGRGRGRENLRVPTEHGAQCRCRTPGGAQSHDPELRTLSSWPERKSRVAHVTVQPTEPPRQPKVNIWKSELSEVDCPLSICFTEGLNIKRGRGRRNLSLFYWPRWLSWGIFPHLFQPLDWNLYHERRWYFGLWIGAKL